MSKLSINARKFINSNDIEVHKSLLNTVKTIITQLSKLKFSNLFLPYAVLYAEIMEEAIKNGIDFIKVSYIRISKLSKSESLDSATKKKYSMLVPIYKNFLEPIPKIIHFIKSDDYSENFSIVHYLCMKSAYFYIKPEKFIFHTEVIPNTIWWRRLVNDIPEIIIDLKPAPTHIGGKLLKFPAHKSDAWRLDLLIDQGGIYMDWDVLVVRSFDEILNSGGVIFGLEKKEERFIEAVGVATIFARPDEPFLKAWRTRMNHVFDGAKCYACHSISLVKEMAHETPTALSLHHYLDFYHPGWYSLEEMFKPLPHPRGSTQNVKLFNDYFIVTYGSHLF